MPKKSGKKSSNQNKDSKKVKSTTKATDSEPANEEQFKSKPGKPNENKLQINSTSSQPSEATVPIELTPPIDPETYNENRRYSKRKIQSNWQRYEIHDESATTRGYDFEILKNAESGIGSHFQFQDEKDWEEEEDSDSMKQLQSLDLNSLALSLSCIPFHQRLCIDPKYFTSEQICKFETDAQLQQVKYQKSLASATPETKIGNRKPMQMLPPLVETPIQRNDTGAEAVATATKSPASQPCISKVSQGSTSMEDELEDELDALLALNIGKVQNMRSIDIATQSLALVTEKERPSTSKSVPEIRAISEENVNDWLDSALDE